MSEPTTTAGDTPDRPRAVIRTTADDFVVDELPAYEPSGEGSHAFVRLRKRGLTTAAALDRLAQVLGVPGSEMGVAGLKDRHAVTSQWVSIPLEGRPEVPAQLEDLGARIASTFDPTELEILEIRRHEHKLKPGHLRGNRFTLTLREVDGAAQTSIEAALSQAATLGVPNHFGVQRFGRDGDNAAAARAFVAGQAKPPRDRRRARLLFSALQSQLFNAVLDRRIEEETWSTVLAGDVAKKTDTGGIFVVSEADALEARERAARGELVATGPLFGAKMRRPEGRPLALELDALKQSELTVDDFARYKKLGEGTRRPLRFHVGELHCDKDEAEQKIRVSFVLPKGCYATTVLMTACTVFDPHRSSPESSAKGREELS